VRKDGLDDKAKAILNELKLDFECSYDEKDSIGKRYRRNDALGTPFCITIDHDTAKDNAVTVRERDTMLQSRIQLNELHSFIGEKVSMKSIF
jgi:glycyl-tRNA synthetase